MEKGTLVERSTLASLWAAANEHCVIVYGEWLYEEYEGDTCPPPPDDSEEIIRLVINYLDSAR